MYSIIYKYHIYIQIPIMTVLPHQQIVTRVYLCGCHFNQLQEALQH